MGMVMDMVMDMAMGMEETVNNQIEKIFLISKP
jgi:hypothetical protein